jgi:3-deoxy-D-manno-octulosonate 8-phosphate phosphatase KdsC-like HAD superfamily phosphatase
MKKIGLSACPSDAVSDIKQKSDFICGLKGGEGVFREFSELILKHQAKT